MDKLQFGCDDHGEHVDNTCQFPERHSTVFDVDQSFIEQYHRSNEFYVLGRLQCDRGTANTLPIWYVEKRARWLNHNSTIPFEFRL
jgi:hypothetical protein